ncbi:MAG: hypothetical protein ACHQJ6_09080 [Candidatus Berkiellales bacterium]
MTARSDKIVVQASGMPELVLHNRFRLSHPWPDECIHALTVAQTII